MWIYYPVSSTVPWSLKATYRKAPHIGDDEVNDFLDLLFADRP
jgi:hypothetical protein